MGRLNPDMLAPEIAPGKGRIGPWRRLGMRLPPAVDFPA